jgi:hypothetical protein
VFDFKRDKSVWGGALFWSALVLSVDVLLGAGLVETVRSEQFETTPGIVTKSRIKPGRKGRTVSFEVQYTYTVNGQRYTGTKYHVQPDLVGNRYWFAAADANPVGTPVTVHYDPDDPATAYLATGFRSDVLLVIWCLTPFNLVVVGFAWAGWGYLTGRREFDPARWRCARETSGGWLVRPDPETRFIVRAFVCLLGITFAGFFVCLGYVMLFDFPPPWALPLSMWTVALAATVGFAARESRRALLHINELEGTIAFPHWGERVTVAREDVLGLALTTQTRWKDSNFVHGVALRWRDQFGEERSTPLAEYEEPADADALCAWLSERLQLPTAAQVAV